MLLPRTIIDSKTIRKGLFFFCLCAITLLSIVPDDAETGITIPKLTPSGFFIHAGAYLTTLLLGVMAYPLTVRLALFILMHGLVMEGVQYFIPYRSFNPLDIVANLCGMAAALALYYLCSPKRRG